MDQNDLTKHFRDLLDEANSVRPVKEGLDDSVRGNFDTPYLPPSGGSAIDHEYRELMDRSDLPVCGLIVKAVTDRLAVEGIRGVDNEMDKELWGWWQASSLDSRQGQLFADSLTFGDGYLSVTLAKNGVPRLMPESPLALYAVHDPLDPLKVKEAVKRVGNQGWLSTDEAIFRFQRAKQNTVGWDLEEVTLHPLGECPIVRFGNNLDSMGRSESEIKVALPFQSRLNQTVFTRLLLEAHTAWRQRWIAGIDVEKDAAGDPIPPFRMGVDKLLTAPDPDTKFGEFQASSTSDLLAAEEADLRHLAVATQTPPTLFAVSSVSNISQESLAALDSGLTRKVESKQESNGEAFEYAMVLGGRLIGRDLSQPHMLQMVWTNKELRSLSQRSDAYVKLQAAGLPHSWLMENLMDMDPVTIERVLAATEVEKTVDALAQAKGFGVTNGEPPNPSGV